MHPKNLSFSSLAGLIFFPVFNIMQPFILEVVTFFFFVHAV